MYPKQGKEAHCLARTLRFKRLHSPRLASAPASAPAFCALLPVTLVLLPVLASSLRAPSPPASPPSMVETLAFLAALLMSDSSSPAPAFCAAATVAVACSLTVATCTSVVAGPFRATGSGSLRFRVLLDANVCELDSDPDPELPPGSGCFAGATHTPQTSKLHCWHDQMGSEFPHGSHDAVSLRGRKSQESNSFVWTSGHRCTRGSVSSRTLAFAQLARKSASACSNLGVIILYTRPDTP